MTHLDIRHVGLSFVLALAWLTFGAFSASAEIDRSRYMSPDEVAPGMTGIGLSVMSGTEIETFKFQVVSVMRNAFTPKQDVILVRCSGLNLEHSGIVAGMSGSPCYVVGDDGSKRMIGAVAYGWSFNKDPICGVQPITQMLPIPTIRHPALRQEGGDHGDNKQASNPPEPSSQSPTKASMAIDQIVGDLFDEPIPGESRFSLFNSGIKRTDSPGSPKTNRAIATPYGQMQPLPIPLSISAKHPQTLAFIQNHFSKYNFVPVSGGSGTANTTSAAGMGEKVKLEPGSAICVPFMLGDLAMQGLGTCTEVDGDRALGFGHPMFGMGHVDFPMATGMVHTVIPSIVRSNKIGAALDVVGTLWGDDNTGIFGVIGPAPAMVPFQVKVKDDYGQNDYNFNVLHEETFTPLVMSSAIIESVFAHSDPPKKHTITYTVKADFEDVGTYQTSNFTSMEGLRSVWIDLLMPVMSVLNAPFQEVRLASASVDVTISEGAHLRMIDRVSIPYETYKPGETVEIRIRWQLYRQEQNFVDETVTFELPETLPDGSYQIMLGGAMMQLNAIRTEKPHLFQAENTKELLAAMNRVADYPANKLYMRMRLPDENMAIDQLEMPNVPSFVRQIHADSKRPTIKPYAEALTKTIDKDFQVNGMETINIKIDRHADQ